LSAPAPKPEPAVTGLAAPPAGRRRACGSEGLRVSRGAVPDFDCFGASRANGY